MTHTHSEPMLNPSVRAKLAIVAVALALLALSFGASELIHAVRHDQLIIPDEKVAAVALLEQKLSGPGYFVRTPGTASELSATENSRRHDGEVRISVTDAQAQVDRIVQARQFDGARAAKVHQLIDELAEAPDSRMVGSPELNLLRLNLALDKLR